MFLFYLNYLIKCPTSYSYGCCWRGNPLGKRPVEKLGIVKRIVFKMEFSEVGLEGEHPLCLVQDRGK